MNIPEGFNTVTPYFFVKDAVKFVEFLTQAFGGDEIGRHADDDGTILNSQVRIGTSTLMISEAREPFPPMAASYYLYVEDADSTVKKALAQGATLQMEVRDMPYGDRQGGVVDPFGNIWWISQRLVDRPYV